ncbi:hypothetical protein BV898_18973 [Hypsibius exemplaris]|uniref:Uncharacterized protein n=1 Tax=Hypsibius exemplaris TaxID=2072580 RepID=A0A9X6RNN8_HYPEX|nr:hypothetical protein BV898_18973 [Hypsibius exemplaris]
MEEAGPRSERDEKKIRQVTKNTLVSFHKEQHGFPVGGSDNELLLACQSGHNFYFCDADSKWLRQLKDTTNIKIHLDGQKYPREPAGHGNDISARVLVPTSVSGKRLGQRCYLLLQLPVSSRDCSRGFELVYGDKTSPIPVTATVSETLPSTDAMTDARQT